MEGVKAFFVNDPTRSADKIMEIFTTHPNMLKMVKHMSSLIA
jgi:hypothetical protein